MSWVFLLSKELENYSGLINAVAAVSTFAAVIVSLKLAKSSYSPKITAEAYVGHLIQPDSQGKYSKKNSEKNIAVSIQNRGPIPITLHLNAFIWKFWRHDIAMMQNPKSPDFRYSNLIIPPAEGSLVILTDRIEELHERMLDQKLWFLKWRMRLEVHGSDGVIHYAKLSTDLRNRLSKNKKI